MKTNKKDLITKTYFNPSLGLTLKKTYENAKKIDSTITLKDVKDVISNTENKNIFDKTIDYNKMLPIVSQSGTFQAGITFYEQFKKFNSGYIGLLTLVNINTKKAYVYPLKSKSSEEIIKNLIMFLNEVKISRLETDAGSEFTNKNVTDLLKSRGVTHIYYNKEIQKHKNALSIVERFNRTIRELIDSYMTTFKTNKYIYKLKELGDNYNNSTHSTTGLAPNNTNDKIENEIYVNNKKKYDDTLRYIELEDPIFIDDDVRILKNRGVFKKGMKTRYSKNIYKVVDVKGTDYYLKSKDGKKTKIVKPYMIKVVNDEIINPNLNKTESQIKTVKTKLKNEKVNNKIKKVLKEDGIDVNNQMRQKLRSQVRKNK